MEIIEKTIGDVDVTNIMLPVGWRNDAGELKRFCTLIELTGEAEEKIADPKIRDNPGKLITELIYAIMDSFDGQKINKDVIRGLSTIDRDFLIFLVHKISFGNTVKWVHTCPNPSCEELNTISIDIDTLKVRYLDETAPQFFSFSLPRPIKEVPDIAEPVITIILPTGFIQEKVAPIGKGNPAVATTALMQMITHKLGHLEGMIPNNVFQKMSSKNRQAIQKYLTELNLGVQLEVEETCAVCGTTFKTMIPIMSLLGE